LPTNPLTDPFTPEMEIYRAFSNFSGGMRLPGSGSGSEVQVEGVCVGEWRKPPCPKKPCPPPSCDHIKIALVNSASAATTAVVGLRVRFCDAVGAGTAVSLDGTVPGVQKWHEGITACGNESQTMELNAGALVVVECKCK
jgi:hypothetical protein